MNAPKVQTDRRQGNLPLLSVMTASVFVIAGILGAVFAKNDEVLALMGGLIVASVPGLLAATFAERASRDIRNGVVQNKMESALESTGVTEMARLNPEDIKRINALLLNLQSDDDKRIDLRRLSSDHPDRETYRKDTSQ
jgi:hypothetical protein